MIYYNSNNVAPLFMSEGQQRQEQSFNNRYTALILEETEKLCNKLITEFTNRGMAAAGASMASSLL
jgi:hypothetical protein